jgi:hypothetical protein
MQPAAHVEPLLFTQRPDEGCRAGWHDKLIRPVAVCFINWSLFITAVSSDELKICEFSYSDGLRRATALSQFLIRRLLVRFTEQSPFLYRKILYCDTVPRYGCFIRYLRTKSTCTCNYRPRKIAALGDIVFYLDFREETRLWTLGQSCVTVRMYMSKLAK